MNAHYHHRKDNYMATEIRKRNGKITEFNSQKIRNAIYKANSSVQTETLGEKDLNDLTEQIANSYVPKNNMGQSGIEMV